MDPKKVYIIAKQQAPNYIKNIQAFLSFANFYWKFIYNFLGMAAPLTAIIQIKGLSIKGRKMYLCFTQTPKYKKAF